MLTPQKIYRKFLVYAGLLLGLGSWFGCGKSQESPKKIDIPNSAQADAGAKCKSNTGVSLNLQDQGNSSGLKVSYEKAIENGTDVSYDGSIKSILSRYCSNCHRQGALLPQNPMLTTFSQASAAGASILAAVKGGTMPPLNPFAGRGLVKYLEAWSQAGYPETLEGSASGDSNEESSKKDESKSKKDSKSASNTQLSSSTSGDSSPSETEKRCRSNP
jgi:hypothetical protein